MSSGSLTSQNMSHQLKVEDSFSNNLLILISGRSENSLLQFKGISASLKVGSFKI